MSGGADSPLCVSVAARPLPPAPRLQDLEVSTTGPTLPRGCACRLLPPFPSPGGVGGSGPGPAPRGGTPGGAALHGESCRAPSCTRVLRSRGASSSSAGDASGGEPREDAPLHVNVAVGGGWGGSVPSVGPWGLSPGPGVQAELPAPRKRPPPFPPPALPEMPSARGLPARVPGLRHHPEELTGGPRPPACSLSFQPQHGAAASLGPPRGCRRIRAPPPGWL